MHRHIIISCWKQEQFIGKGFVCLFVFGKGQEKKRTQLTNIRNERGIIIIEFTEIQKTIKEYYEYFYVKKYNLHEVDKFFEQYNLLKLTQDETENLNKTLHIKGIAFLD